MKNRILLLCCILGAASLQAAGNSSPGDSTSSSAARFPDLSSWWNGDLIQGLYKDTTGQLSRAGEYVTETTDKFATNAVRFNPFSGVRMDSEEWAGQFRKYGNRSGATADWFGLGKPMADAGLSVSGTFKYVYFGEVMGGFPNGNQPRSNFIPEVKLKFLYDFAKIFGIDGLTIQSNWRYRNVAGNNPGYEAGTAGITSGWNPTDMSSGFGIRMLQQYAEYSTKNKAFTINAGLENPYEMFLQQPLSKLFENNMINSSKGIGSTAGPGIPVNSTYPGPTSPRLYGAPGVSWSSSYLAWGATLRVQPSRTTYIQAGLYEAVAGATGVSPSQYSATSVYPYTTVPQSYAGSMKSSGQIVPVVGANGLPSGKFQNVGWVPAYQNNHGITTGGAPGNNFNAKTVNAKPPVPAGAGYSSYSSSPYNQNGVGGNWSGNGLFNTYEAGWTPKLGKDKLEGKYAIGCYIWGLPNYSYTPTTYQYVGVNKSGQAVYATNPKPFPNSYNGLSAGLYLQADQMLFRQKTVSDSPAAASGKDVKNPVTTPTGAKLTDRGLYSFNEANFTSPYYNAMPFYFQTGLVYKGLLDLRPADQMGIAMGAGFYSTYLNQWQNSQNQASGGSTDPANYAANAPTKQYLPAYTSTEVLECFYAFQINKWAYVKPYAQWLYNPAGNGTIGTDLTIGARLMVSF